MSGHWLYTLTAGPLGLYLWILAVWHSDRHPRVVSGLVDFGLLAFGIGGVLVFGPFGQLLAARFFGRPDATDWLAIGSGLGLIACLLARRALHRFVVYHAAEDQVREALAAALDEMKAVGFEITLTGFEDRARGRRLTVESTTWLHCTLVEAHGPDAEALIQALRGRVRAHLGQIAMAPSPVALLLYSLSLAVMVVPMLGMILSQPHARNALRGWLERLTGG